MSQNSTAKKKPRFNFQKLGHRLSFYFVSIGAIFTVVMVSALLYKQFLDDRSAVYEEAEKTILTVKQQLARSLWNVDQDSARILLEGIYRQPFIKGIRVVETLGQVYEYGILSQPAHLKTDLSFNEQVMGRLEVSIDEDLIQRGVFQQFKTIVLNTMLVIGLIAFVFSIIVKRAITKHLSDISRFTAENENIGSKTLVPIKLNRKNYEDEITDLVNALNRGRQQVVEFAIERESYENQLQYQAPHRQSPEKGDGCL